ncbi:MAG TPA: DUF308 domain-containing protein [Acidobacteriaceae bacterium]|nr:DUF308 domain-containing protein [Acidobacteriaceae bacterium]
MSTTFLSSDQNTTSAVKVSAIVMILLGVAALFVPAAAGIGVTILFGATVLMAGFAYGVLAFTASGTGAFFLRLLVSIAFTAAGVYLLGHPSMGLESLTMVVAVAFGIEGIAEAGSFFTLRALPGSGFLLLNAIFSLVLAFLIWRSWPSSSSWAIGTLVGVNLISTGLTRTLFVQRTE